MKRLIFHLGVFVIFLIYVFGAIVIEHFKIIEAPWAWSLYGMAFGGIAAFWGFVSREVLK